MTPREILQDHFEALQLPAPATQWLLAVWDAIQAFDDLKDCDKNIDLNKLIWDSLVIIPGNPFFIDNAKTLIPIMAVAFLKWNAANSAESNGRADHLSFVWRAGYYDVVLITFCLCFGYGEALQRAEHILRIYGENFQHYMEEFHA